MKKILIAVVALIVILGAWYLITAPQNDSGLSHIEQNSDPLNATYIIDGESITLVNGSAKKEIAPDSASVVETSYFGNEVYTDLNNDGREDVVFLLTQNSGGSGTFFYVVAALNTEDGYVGSHGLLLGDRIAPQTTEVSQNPSHKNVIVVDYTDRAPGESFATQPSVGKSIWLKLDTATMQFGEVEQNFEGEANPDVMTLDMKTWTWIKTTYNNDTELVPNESKAFTITFKDNNTFSATTDCNVMSGGYEVHDNQITFDENIAMTKKFCEGSQEQDFASLLGEIHSFFFTSKGGLVFDLQFDSGSAVFQ